MFGLRKEKGIALNCKKIAGFIFAVFLIGLIIVYIFQRYHSLHIYEKDSFCVGYDYSISSYGKNVYWGCMDGIFYCDDRNCAVTSTFDFLEDDESGTTESNVVAGSSRYIYYIKSFEKTYYEFHVFDKKENKDEIVYSSVSDARKRHEYLGINQSVYEGIRKKQDNYERIPTKFWICENVIYYQQEDEIFKNAPGTIFNEQIIKGVDLDASLFVTNKCIVYLSENKKMYSYDMESKRNIKILDGMYKNMYCQEDTMYVQKIDGSIWKWGSNEKMTYVDRIKGNLVLIRNNIMIYRDLYEKNYVVKELALGKERQEIKILEDDVGLEIKRDNIYIGQYNYDKKKAVMRKIKIQPTTPGFYLANR